MIGASVHDPWVVRRLPAVVRAAGFEVERLDSHGFVQTGEADYMLSVIDRGVGVLRTAGRLGDAAAEALMAEGRHRLRAGAFFGFIAYAGLIARRPPRSERAARPPRPGGPGAS